MLCSRDGIEGIARAQEATGVAGRSLQRPPAWPVRELLLAFEREGLERGVLFAVEGLEGGRVAVGLEGVHARPFLDGQTSGRGCAVERRDVLACRQDRTAVRLD